MVSNTYTLPVLKSTMLYEYEMKRKKVRPSILALEDSHTLGEWLVAYYEGKEQEEALVIALDEELNVLGFMPIAKGQRNHVAIDPTDALRFVIRLGAPRYVIAHNHVGQAQPKPSPEDISTTSDLFDTSATVGIYLEDSIVVGDEGYFSLRENADEVREIVRSQNPRPPTTSARENPEKRFHEIVHELLTTMEVDRSFHDRLDAIKDHAVEPVKALMEEALAASSMTNAIRLRVIMRLTKALQEYGGLLTEKPRQPRSVADLMRDLSDRPPINENPA